jgi:hypothetical protein
MGDDDHLAEPVQEDQLAIVRECLNRQRPSEEKNGKLKWLRCSDLQARCARAVDRRLKGK